MADFIEIDFIEAGDKGSGDAIAIRYRRAGVCCIHVVDGGYKADGRKIVEHVQTYYGNTGRIDHVVLTHSDGDHAAGLETVLKELEIGSLWMNRPWEHVDDLMPRFKYYGERSRLIARLKRDFPNVADLEEIAGDNGIPIGGAFSGTEIGDFTVLSPGYETYLDLIVASDKTPVPATAKRSAMVEIVLAADWGEENLKGDTDGTSPENETSIVQFADMFGSKFLLTGDAGVRGLTEAHEVAVSLGQSTMSLDFFQAPHHGSRRNLSPEVLDSWLGGKLPKPADSPKHYAIISANRHDPEHPKKAVVRALIHRGRGVYKTHGTLHVSRGAAPKRGWASATPLIYPTDMED